MKSDRSHRMIISKILNNKSSFYILFIILAAIIAYSNSFQVPFQFDDDPNITENPLIKDMGYLMQPSQYCSRIDPLSEDQHLCKFFKLRYVGYITFAINYGIHGLNVAGYHVVNLLIHMVNGLLVYFLVILTFRTPFLRETVLRDYVRFIAFFAALLFVTHPIQTEAVTYIVQRFTSLTTLFYILSLVLYIRWRLLAIDVVCTDKSGQDKLKFFYWQKVILYSASVLCAVLAMKTKEIAFTLPVTIVLYELLFFKDSMAKRVMYCLPFLLTMLIIPLSLLDIDKPFEYLLSDVSRETRLQTGISRWEYLLTEFRVIVTYLRLFILPVNQNLDYDYPIYNSFFNPEVLLSFLFLFFLGLSGLYLLYRFRNTAPQTRLISFGIFWFFITISVESSVIPIVDVIFEHRVYLPSVGMIVAITTGIFWAVHNWKRRLKTIERSIVIVLALIAIVFAGAAYKRNTVWQDYIRLWQDVVDKSPQKARGYYNLGHAYQDRKIYDKSIETYNRAISLDLFFVKAYHNIANIYVMEKDYDKALEYYTLAITINPTSDLTYFNRGRLFFIMNEFDKAIDDFTKAILIKPSNSMYYKNRGRVYAQKKRFDDAIEDFTTAIGMKPEDSEIYALRGLAYSMAGNKMDAWLDYQKACNLGYQKACNAVR